MRVAGIGFRGDATLDDLRRVLAAVEAQGGPAQALASLPDKTDAPALRALAAERGLPLRGVAVAAVATPTQSPRIRALHGTGSVAEAAALAAAGPGARLSVGRIVAPGGRATAAMAETEEPQA